MQEFNLSKLKKKKKNNYMPRGKWCWSCNNILHI